MAVELPHSRACGIREHKHGFLCSSNCPTCGGKTGYRPPKEDVELPEGVWPLPEDAKNIMCAYCLHQAEYFKVAKRIVGELVAICERHVKGV